MDALNTWNQLWSVDWKIFVAALLLLAIFTVAVSKLFEEVIKIACKMFGIKSVVTQKTQDHEMLLGIKETIDKIVRKQDEDAENSIVHDKEIKESLQQFMDEVRPTIDEIKKEQLEIRQSQNGMNLKLEDMARKNDLIRNALMESMCDRIEQKSKVYIKQNGIPQDEYDSFVSLYDAYRSIGGNHSAEAKFNYCINNLQITKN